MNTIMFFTGMAIAAIGTALMIVGGIRHVNESEARVPTNPVMIAQLDGVKKKRAMIQSEHYTSIIGCLVTVSDLSLLAPEDASQELPCGNRFTIKKGERFPAHNIPCPCGDARHWLFKREPYPSAPVSPGGEG